MGALANLADLLSKIENSSQQHRWTRLMTAPAGAHWCSWWQAGTGLPLGTVPGAAAICDRTTVGALGQLNAPSTQLRAMLSAFGLGFAGIDGLLMICDRLAHMGGLNATVTTPQTVSTPALTRYTSGVGVMAFAEVYTPIGATATTITMSYTDQDGNAGIVSQPSPFGGVGFQNAARCLPISLALGDTGVRAVSTVTVLATTGTAGDFGVTLLKPLLMVPIIGSLPFPIKAHPLTALGMNLPEVLDDACLAVMMMVDGQVNATLLAQLDFMET
jgi:hypothetical protein